MSTATLIRSLGQPKMLMIYNQNEKKKRKRDAYDVPHNLFIFAVVTIHRMCKTSLSKTLQPQQVRAFVAIKYLRPPTGNK